MNGYDDEYTGSGRNTRQRPIEFDDSAGAGKATGPTIWQHVPTGAYDTPTMTMLPAAPKGSHVREIWNIMITATTTITTTR